MIILPKTPITDATFNKWKAHRIDTEIEGDRFHYYVVPLVDIDESELEHIDEIPAIYSSESGEFIDTETGEQVYTMRLYDEDLPEMTSEEEVEILYKILTKQEIYRR